MYFPSFSFASSSSYSYSSSSSALPRFKPLESVRVSLLFRPPYFRSPNISFPQELINKMHMF
jgi:hypothetical protein